MKTAPKGIGRPIFLLSDVEKIREKGGSRFDLKIPRLLIRAGEFLAVVGPSGCGKSTLLDFLGLTLKPNKYKTYGLAGPSGPMDLGLLSEHRLAGLRRSELGYVLQSGGLLPYLTTRDNILLPAQMNGLPKNVALRRLETLALRLGIGDQLNKKPAHLSGGQRQRVAIARALIHKPKIVLADEPTAAVDFNTAKEICAVFKELTAKSHMSLVMVTHDIGLVKNLADRFVSFNLRRVSPEHTVSTLFEAKLNHE